MTVSELISVLEMVKAEKGDINVVVQYRDDGGTYYGTDDTIICEVNNDEIIL